MLDCQLREQVISCERHSKLWRRAQNSFKPAAHKHLRPLVVDERRKCLDDASAARLVMDSGSRRLTNRLNARLDDISCEREHKARNSLHLLQQCSTCKTQDARAHSSPGVVTRAAGAAETTPARNKIP